MGERQQNKNWATTVATIVGPLHPIHVASCTKLLIQVKDGFKAEERGSVVGEEQEEDEDKAVVCRKDRDKRRTLL